MLVIDSDCTLAGVFRKVFPFHYVYRNNIANILTHFPHNDVIQKTTTLSFMARKRRKIHGQCQSSHIGLPTKNVNTRNVVNIIEFYTESVGVIHGVNLNDKQLLLNDDSRNSLKRMFSLLSYGLNIGGYKILYPPVKTLGGYPPVPPWFTPWLTSIWI